MAAYGSGKDVSIYRDMGLQAQQIFIVGKASKKLYSQAQVGPARLLSGTGRGWWVRLLSDTGKGWRTARARLLSDTGRTCIQRGQGQQEALLSGTGRAGGQGYSQAQVGPAYSVGKASKKLYSQAQVGLAGKATLRHR